MNETYQKDENVEINVAFVGEEWRFGTVIEVIEGEFQEYRVEYGVELPRGGGRGTAERTVSALFLRKLESK